jgi:hypothetical protein
MSPSHRHFKTFLADHVNLNPTRLEKLRGHVSAVNEFLTEHPDFSGIVTGDVVPQGSYARRTLVKPYQGTDYDADVLLQMDEVDGWEPCKYTKRVHEVLESSARYKGKATLKKRCVQLAYAGGFHVDIVPFVTRADEKTYITHRTENRWIPEDPTALTAWFEAKNRAADRQLLKVVRLMKFVRDRSSADIPSVVLNAIFAGCVEDFADEGAYTSLPAALVRLGEAANSYLAPYSSPPWIDDRTGQNLADRWTQTDFLNYKNQLGTWAKQIRDAYDSSQSESVEKWRKVFGDKFGVGSPAALAAAAPARHAPSDQTLDDLGIEWRPDSRYHIKMIGRIKPKKFRSRPRPLPSSGDMVLIGKQLVFKVDECDVPPPVTYYWKVRNVGTEAEVRGMQRGEIEDRGSQIEESTSFPGDHWVQVWAVKNGVAVASDRQDVIITPKNAA